MSSINTNSASMVALQSLAHTNRMLEKTQSAISTGLRVAGARDNAAYWSIATTMRSDRGALSTVKDALGLGAATVDVAYTAIQSAVDVTDEIKKKLVAAREPGVDRVKIQTEISELQKQLRSIADSASFSGENWLAVDSGSAAYNDTKNIVASFNRTADGVAIETMSIDITNTELYDANDQSGIMDKDRTINATTFSVATMDISVLTDSPGDLETLEDYIVGVDNALTEMTSSATSLGAIQARIEIQQAFISSLMDAIDRGVGQLVDADMNEESTKLQALQVKQQLGIQALSIANSNSQNIMSLFQ